MFNLFNGAKNASTATPQGCFKLVITGVSNCVNQVLETPVNFAPEWQLAGRFDWNIGPNDRAYLRMQYDVGTQPTYTDPLTPLFNTSSYQPEYQGQLNETHTFGPTLTNQFLLAATWYSAIFKAPDQAATQAAFPSTLLTLDGSLNNFSSGTAVGGIGFAFPQGRNVTQFQIDDDVSKSLGNHTLKFGAKYHRNYVSDHDFGNRITGLEFAGNLTGFYDGQGAFLQQNFSATTNAPVRLYEVAGYIQDDWRIKPNLTISPALRIEHASNPICVTLCFAQLSEPLAELTANPSQPYNTIIQANRRNALLSYPNVQWEPRISFAWQPFGSGASGFKRDTVVRGGAGIFYDIFPGVVSDSMAQNSPLFNPFTVFAGTGCPGYLSPNQPGNLFSCASAANTAFLQAFNNSSNTVAQVPNVVITQPNTKAPEYYKWSLEIQKGFGANDSIDIGYYGNKSIHIPIPNNSANAFCNPAAALLPSGAANPCFGFTVNPLPLTNPTSQFGEVTNIQSEGNSNYNGLVVSYKHRFSGGWGGGGVFQFNYTYSKALDFVSDGGLGFNFNTVAAQSILNPNNPNNISQNYGPAEYDARHVINANYVWEIPIRKALGGHGWAPLVDGWQVSGTVFYRTGFPFTVIDGAEAGALNANNFYGPVFPEPLAAVTTNCSNPTKYAGNTAPTTATCFGPKSSTASHLFGNGAGGAQSETTLGARGLRSAFRGPHYVDTDFSFMKNTKIPHLERANLGVGLQFFNFFNHPNFYLPVNDISSPAFGTIQQMVNPPTSILGSFLGGDASPRLIQLKAQLTF
jgi:hypothetical protein